MGRKGERERRVGEKRSNSLSKNSGCSLGSSSSCGCSSSSSYGRCVWVFVAEAVESLHKACRRSEEQRVKCR